MPLSGSAFWALLLPVERTNLVTNPSFERGTAGWGTIQAGTIGTTSAFQQFGAWAGSIAPTSNGTTGAMGPTFTAGDGTRYTFSAYVRGQSGIPYKIGVGDSNGANVVGTTDLTGGGTWHRYSGTWVESGGATRRFIIKKGGDADTGAIYIDGVQVEAELLSTYIDGDQDGCFWIGAPHASQSIRSGTYRGGGSIVALADLGLKPDQHVGIGMPPQEITGQSYALLPGAEYQRSRSGERPFTITFKPILGTTQKDYHITRRTIINALKPDLVDPQQPVRFWFTGGQGTMAIDAVYAGGLELGEMNGPMAEEGAIRFIAHDPYWYATTQEGTALAGRVALGSSNFIVKRSPLGVWGTLGVQGTTTNALINDLAWDGNGTVFVGGSFGSAGGTAARFITQYIHATDRWGTLIGGTLDFPVFALARNTSGTLFVGGQFGLAGGTTAVCIAQHINNAWGTLTGGTVSSTSSPRVEVIYPSQTGTLFVGGVFVGVGGTATRAIAQHVNGVWGTLAGGTLATAATSAEVYAITQSTNGTLYIGGLFGSAAGTANANNIAVHINGSWGTINGGAVGDDATIFVNDFAIGPNNLLYVGGQFATIGGITAANIAAWNGVLMSALGNGIPSGGTANVQTLAIDQNANLITGGQYTQGSAGNIAVPDSGAVWNSYTWLPLDINITGNAAFNKLLYTSDKTLYAAGSFIGTAQAAAVAQVVNTGLGEAYPTVKVRTTGTGTVRMYQIVNTLTGDGIYLNYAILPGEEITLKTRPGARSFTSSAFGNILGKVVPGSNFTGFRLVSGTNYISLFCDSGSVAASIYWQPRSDSVDGGTTY